MKTIDSGNITDFEYSFLRSYALVLSDVDIQQMLSINVNDFNNIQSSLFLKLEVQNTYFAVKRAYEYRLLCPTGYTDEVVKTKALAFLQENIQKFQEISQTREKAVWECYDLLLEFRNELNSWQLKKVAPKENFKDWMRLDPYELRAKAVYEKISLVEFGRILYQIISHRGYRYGERNSKLVESVLKSGQPEDGKVGFADMMRLTRN